MGCFLIPYKYYSTGQFIGQVGAKTQVFLGFFLGFYVVFMQQQAFLSGFSV
jgi:hypothetical protein